MYANDLSEPKDEFLINKREDTGTKHFNDPNAFIVFSNTMDDVYENIDTTTQTEKQSFDSLWWLISLAQWKI